MTRKVSFEQWMSECNSVLRAMIGMDSDGMPDFNYRAVYEDYKTPAEGARRAIKAAQGV